MLRIARSVRPDPGTFTLPLDVARRPATDHPLFAAVVHVDDAPAARGKVMLDGVEVWVGDRRPHGVPAGGDPVPVQDGEARYVVRHVGWAYRAALVVQRRPGEVLTLTALRPRERDPRGRPVAKGPSAAQLARIADSVTVRPTAWHP
jgi:hypothetical protein